MSSTKTNGDYDVLPNTLSVGLSPSPHDLEDGDQQHLDVQGWEVLEACRGLIEASTASACHSGSCATPSKVLLNSGLTPVEALRTLRLSVGVWTTVEDARDAAKILHDAFLSVLSAKRKEISDGTSANGHEKMVPEF